MENVITLTQSELGAILAAVFAENGFRVERVEYVIPGATDGTTVSARVISSIDDLQVFKRPIENRGESLRNLLTGGIASLEKPSGGPGTGTTEPGQ